MLLSLKINQISGKYLGIVTNGKTKALKEYLCGCLEDETGSACSKGLVNSS